MSETTIQTTECLLRVERHDGNDPIEAVVHLPFIPRKGDLIEVWNAQGGPLQRDRDGDLRHSGESAWLKVQRVVLCSYAPERIEVWVRLDGYDMAEAERVMEAADRNEQP